MNMRIDPDFVVSIPFISGKVLRPRRFVGKL